MKTESGNEQLGVRTSQGRKAGWWSLNGEHWFTFPVRVLLVIGLVFSIYLVIR